ncbi:uncharacterized protein LOC141825681 [Curcuma longa]|uniref:uncharacterized protein LOC141825681 n=1 Tax=Curcuma longa TaxID=136217 RepID=UPI003D9E3EDA
MGPGGPGGPGGPPGPGWAPLPGGPFPGWAPAPPGGPFWGPGFGGFLPSWCLIAVFTSCAAAVYFRNAVGPSSGRVQGLMVLLLLFEIL